MTSSFNRFWMIVALVAGASLYVLVSTQSVGAQQRAETDSCTAAGISAVMRSAGAKPTQAESAQLASWCREARATDAQQSNPSAMLAMSTPSRPASTMDFSAAPPKTAIWCSKQICVCWKGKKWNGCVHTDKLCAAGLECGPGGKLCGCAAKN